MWDVSLFISGFLLGGLFAHSLAIFLYNEKIRILRELKADLELLYQRVTKNA